MRWIYGAGMRVNEPKAYGKGGSTLIRDGVVRPSVEERPTELFGNLWQVIPTSFAKPI